MRSTCCSSGTWIEGLAANFTALYPSITVTPVYVDYPAFEGEVLSDIDGDNNYHAYLVPTMADKLGSLAEHLLDMSDFMVDNVNDVDWHTIGRFFPISRVALRRKGALAPRIWRTHGADLPPRHLCSVWSCCAKDTAGVCGAVSPAQWDGSER